MPERVSEHHRIAVLGGVYANAEALAAVLADARRRDAEAVFCLGDLGGFGAHPDRVFPLLRQHGVRVVRGNYDEAVATAAPDCNCGYTDPRDNHYARISYAYTVAHTSVANRAWLATLPGHRRIALGPHRVLMCHGSPRRINEFLWESTTPDGLLRRLLVAHAVVGLGVGGVEADADLKRVPRPVRETRQRVGQRLRHHGAVREHGGRGHAQA